MELVNWVVRDVGGLGVFVVVDVDVEMGVLKYGYVIGVVFDGEGYCWGNLVVNVFD